MRILFCSILLLSFAACTPVTNCSNLQQYYLVRLTDAATNGAIPDTSANLVAYKKGTAFTRPVDTCKHIETIEEPTGTVIFLERCKADCDNYDWEFIFSPSGRVFTIKDITHHARSVKGRKEEGEFYCANNISMIVNDSLYNIHGDEGGRNSVSYVHIHIKY